MTEAKPIIGNAFHIFDKWDDLEFRERLRENGYEEITLQLENTSEENIVRYLASISDFPEESIFQKASRNSYSARLSRNANYTPDIEVKKIKEGEYIARYNSRTVNSKILSLLGGQLGQTK